MTLDVNIGKRIEYLDEDGSVQYRIEMCPEADHDICKPEFTSWSRESYRSGSSDFWRFFQMCTDGLYYHIRKYPDTNDYEIIPLKPILHEINGLFDKFFDEANRDRMKWLKFWSNRAVSLYGDDAYISFS